MYPEIGPSYSCQPAVRGDLEAPPGDRRVSLKPHMLASSFLEGCNVLTAAVTTSQQRIPSILGWNPLYRLVQPRRALDVYGSPRIAWPSRVHAEAV